MMLQILALLQIQIASALIQPSLPAFRSASLLYSKRNIPAVIDWAHENGVTFQNGFHLEPSMIAREDDNSSESEMDWGTVCKDPIDVGTTVLSVPRKLVLSSNTVEESLGSAELEPAFAILKQSKCQELTGQFMLFTKILVEQEKAEKSLWWTWLQFLPEEFDTAIFMDKVEMELLAPFAFALADLQKRHYQSFRSALQSLIGTLISQNTFDDEDQLQRAFSIVFTRSWKSENAEDAECSDICPLGDMFNHAAPSNVVARYTSKDRIDFVTKQPISTSDQALHLSYGFPTNPYRFLCIFGFVDETQPEIFIQVLFANPTPEHIQLGCNDREKMVFRSIDGMVATTVWDCTLYAILEQIPDQQTAFWNACKAKDDKAKSFLHDKYRLEVCLTLRKHIAQTCTEFQTLVHQANEIILRAPEEQHRILPKIQQQNQFLLESFLKVKHLVDALLRQELQRRSQLSTQTSPGQDA